MTGWRVFHLKNEMLAANFLANFIGAVLVQSLIVKTEITFPDSLFDYLGVGKHNQGIPCRWGCLRKRPIRNISV
jgi:hypothetical protein